MILKTYVALYGLTALAFVVVDFVWLGVVAPGFYDKHLGQLLRPQYLKVPAILFYSVYIGGVLVFAVLPGLDAESLLRTVALGAFLGFFAYATFDLTSMALIEGFTWTVVVVDLAWGTVLTASVAAAGFGFGRWLGF